MVLGLPKFSVRKGRSCAWLRKLKKSCAWLRKLKKPNPHTGMRIPKSVWGSIPNRVAPHPGLGIIPIWGATYKPRFQSEAISHSVTTYSLQWQTFKTITPSSLVCVFMSFFRMVSKWEECVNGGKAHEGSNSWWHGVVLHIRLSWFWAKSTRTAFISATESTIEFIPEFIISVCLKFICFEDIRRVGDLLEALERSCNIRGTRQQYNLFTSEKTSGTTLVEWQWWMVLFFHRTLDDDKPFSWGGGGDRTRTGKWRELTKEHWTHFI